MHTIFVQILVLLYALKYHTYRFFPVEDHASRRKVGKDGYW